MDLLQVLRQLAQKRSEIKMLNIYKGLPISYETSIDSIGDSEIQMRSNKHQIACLYYQGESYLQVEELPFIIRSQVMSLNLAKENAIFSNFEAVKNNIGSRGQIRVEPNEPLIVAIQFNGSASEILAPLADISAGGASVYFETYMFPARLSQPGTGLTMTISLPDSASQKLKKLTQKPSVENRKLSMPLRTNPHEGQDGNIVITARGMVIAVHPEFHLKRYRVSAKLFFKDLSRTVILQYISQRQSEIIQDLRVLSDELYSLKK
ncbi:MAG: hypothetical protein IPJ46_07785 [Anaerolineales bacterium]|nr:hypothetical protein [Anaerolineales bacterium]